MSETPPGPEMQGPPPSEFMAVVGLEFTEEMHGHFTTSVIHAATPEEHRTAEAIGFLHVEAGPLVRSSYHAERHCPPICLVPTCTMSQRLPCVGAAANSGASART